MSNNFNMCKNKIRKKYCFFIFLISVSLVFVGCNKKIENKNNNKILFELISTSDSLFQKKQYAQAIRCFNQIIEIDSNIGKVYYQRGICYVKTDKFQKGINDYLKCVELNYRVVDSYFRLGLSYELLFNYPNALHYYKKAYEMNPDDTISKKRIEYIETFQKSLK